MPLSQVYDPAVQHSDLLYTIIDLSVPVAVVCLRSIHVHVTWHTSLSRCFDKLYVAVASPHCALALGYSRFGRPAYQSRPGQQINDFEA